MFKVLERITNNLKYNIMKRKVISFGKIAFRGNRKENEVEIDMEISHGRTGEKVLTICGIIWNRRHINSLSCGQNLDTIKEYISDSLFNDIYELWKRYHLKKLCDIPTYDLNRIKDIMGI